MAFDTLTQSSAWSFLHRSAIKSDQPVVLSSQSIHQQIPESFSNDSYGHVAWRTLISSSRTPSSELTVGLAICSSGSGYLAHHRHKQAEVYYIVSGSGLVSINGKAHAVEKGAVIYIPSDAEHGIRCTSEEEHLQWIYCFAANDFGDVKYRFS
ncbi:hypothetical protein LTR56_007823 [Elasticomyces elasticus]|nr:hypothetical protein LTR56_007823 [Elasticomyces elasticus]KAK3667872.1 hypothetical protein LTR22_001317 [Elasticomyces elasticus]KAK4932135.1 hypothetical protein LTR49_001432 [Elasticomyces elasticus]KAK5763485.1 hypothetical protein LTS12_006456 [Elasticomyces elasticus]